MNIASLYDHFLASSGVCTDTRKITPNCIFFALKGDTFNGNTFAASALEQGAAYAVIDQAEYQSGEQTILVDNVLKCLQNLATHHRKKLGIPILALTGSNGKTTTKELLFAVLNQKYKVTTTLGNLNNHIGVPLTLLSMDSNTNFGLVEMGANHQGEIKQLCEIALPDYGFITNYGKAHLAGFGGVEGVIKGKSEMFDHMHTHGKICLVNKQDPIQMQRSNGYKRVLLTPKYGNTPLETIQTNPSVAIQVDQLTINSHLMGQYNAKNIIAAIAIGDYFTIPLTACKAGIESYIPKNNRSQWKTTARNELLLDAYNANPSSMRAALENFAQGFPNSPKTVILGDMFELGPTAAAEHQEIADLCAQLNFEHIFLVGENFYTTNTPKAVKKCREFEDLLVAVPQVNLEGHRILIKGSRGMALERIVDHL